MKRPVFCRSCSATLSVTSRHSSDADFGCADSIEKASSTKRSSFSELPLRLTQMKCVAVKRSRCWSIHASVFSSTQRSMTAIRPLLSAALMILPGGMIRFSRSRIRSSTSKFSDSSGRSSDMIGCISRNRPSSSSPCPIRSIRRSSSMRSRNNVVSRSYATTWPRWPALASRQARSAVATASRNVMSRSSSISPIDPFTWKALSPIVNGDSSMASTSAVQMALARRTGASWKRITNSSPPTRANDSASARCDRTRVHN